jgi:hypothetical protein
LTPKPIERARVASKESLHEYDAAASMAAVSTEAAKMLGSC